MTMTRTPSHRMASRSAAVCAACVLLAALTACTNPFRPLVGTSGAVPEPPPRPNSPANALRLFQWCWETRTIAEYEELFTDDFRFAFSAVDSADNPPIDRVEEIAIARRIFVDGTASEPRANRIDLTYNSALLPIPDGRPGKTDPWHKEITTRVVLRVELIEAGSPLTINVEGDVTFFLVRGDSALIPDELVQRGITNQDNTRWFIERWEDKTGGAETAARAQGVTPYRQAASPLSLALRPYTWGEFKHRYRTRAFAIR